MGHRLAHFLFQKHGVVRLTKRNDIGLGPFAKMEKKSSIARCLFLMSAKTHVSLKETKLGLARREFLKRHRAWPDVYF